MDDVETTVAVPSIQIANDVIAAIAGLAATEVDGVVGMTGGLAGGLSEMLGKRDPTKGVKLDVKDNLVGFDLYLVVQFGKKIPEVASRVQEQVKIQVENMTGLHVTHVNIHVQGVSFATSSQLPQNLE
ncbi:MAG: Asp23/Gls24 family envelope stress response protein [Sulfobacillus benefaciens]|uniref:Asp23/Gls24 family envelope stress response protein n=1 Tax=Sulfobacillus benefaciens TaxID=453960 RepID=A0A2T2XL65_9FIRM|nr:MAG: Asp23/Gls24 family envelope stress response protein [Sulfobacillus benefaciens]